MRDYLRPSVNGGHIKKKKQAKADGGGDSQAFSCVCRCGLKTLRYALELDDRACNTRTTISLLSQVTRRASKTAFFLLTDSASNRVSTPKLGQLSMNNEQNLSCALKKSKWRQRPDGAHQISSSQIPMVAHLFRDIYLTLDDRKVRCG